MKLTRAPKFHHNSSKIVCNLKNSNIILRAVFQHNSGLFTILTYSYRISGKKLLHSVVKVVKVFKQHLMGGGNKVITYTGHLVNPYYKYITRAEVVISPLDFKHNHLAE